MHIAKFSKLLINLEKQIMKGKSLEEIDVDDSVEAEIDNDNEGKGRKNFKKVNSVTPGYQRVVVTHTI